MDRSKINSDKLLDLILDDCSGNINRWWGCVEFVQDYMPPFPREDTRPTKCSLKCGESFLRDLGRGVFIWDIHYGKDSEFYTPEGALLALMKAPVPPSLMKEEVWQSEAAKAKVI